MGTERLDEAISPGARLLLDSSILIAYFNGIEPISALTNEIVDGFIRNGRNEAIVSAVTVMETLVRPIRLATGLDRPIADFFKNFPNVVVAPVDLGVAFEAAAIRAMHGLSPPDALIVATGLESGSAYLVTNDSAWIRKLRPIESRIRVRTVADYL